MRSGGVAKTAPQRNPIVCYPDVGTYETFVSTPKGAQGPKNAGAIIIARGNHVNKKNTGPSPNEVARRNPAAETKTTPTAGAKLGPTPKPVQQAPVQLSKISNTKISLEKRNHPAETPVLPPKKKKGAATKVNKAIVTEPPQYELSPLLQACLDKEMEVVLEKIMAAIPAKTYDLPREDKIVVDILRSKGAYRLTEVLELNVKKRILNVHNPLYAKLQFFKAPPEETIKSLRKTFKLPAVSKVSPKVFAVQLATLSEFDEFCNMRNIQFEGFNIKINAVYGFTICPPELQGAIKKKQSDSNATKVNDNDNNVKAQSSNTDTPKPAIKPVATSVNKPVNVTTNVKTPAVKKAAPQPVTNIKKGNKAVIKGKNVEHAGNSDVIEDIESMLDDAIVLDEC